MQRYFANIINDRVYLSQLDEHHVLRVMRNKIGDRIEVAFNNNLFLAEIISTSPLCIKVIEKLEEISELPCDVTLFMCLLKGDKNEFVIQKATELGVKKIVFLSSSRVESYFKQDTFNKKLERFNLIAKEASEQSHRLSIPEIKGIVDINKLDDYLCDYNFVAYEEEKKNAPNISKIKGLSNKSISILIGPEGGLSASEVESLNKKGFLSTSLGHRVLRAETAALYALSMIGYMLEE